MKATCNFCGRILQADDICDCSGAIVDRTKQAVLFSLDAIKRIHADLAKNGIADNEGDETGGRESDNTN